MQEAILQREGIEIAMKLKSFEEAHGITLCCVVLNEEKEIKEFLEYYKPYVDAISIVDGGSIDRTVEIAASLADHIRIIQFDGHYSNQANRAVEMSETDWVLIMDVDERLEAKVLENLRDMINQDEIDCYSFPRKNYLDGEYDPEHYPDYQPRLYRAYCRRIRPVHGEVVGYKNLVELPAEDGNHILHSKPSERHLSRNKAYLAYELRFRHEMGGPGTQTKETFNERYPQLNLDVIKEAEDHNEY
jgi:glycosyltransferase involved in cell wall biosynthesis